MKFNFILRTKTFFRKKRQFSYYNQFKYWILNFIQKKIDPFVKSSYGQMGEDIVIESLLNGPLKHKGVGFYVDVGCNHPQYCSNTFNLYRKGWRGINIDANASLIHLAKKIRPLDINVCAAISNLEYEATFFEFETSLVSSISQNHVNKWSKKCNIIHEKKILTTPLTKVLAKHNAPSRFDILSIDVEGHDYEALSSLDLKQYRPKLIVIETPDLDLSNLESNKIYNYLINNNYKLYGFFLLNSFFLDTQIQ